MKKTIITLAATASLALIGSAFAANKQDTARYEIQNASTHSIALDIYDFSGQWKHPLLRKEKIVLGINQNYVNTLTGNDKQIFVGINVTNIHTKNPKANFVDFFSGDNPSFQQNTGTSGMGNLKQLAQTNHCGTISNGISQCTLKIN